MFDLFKNVTARNQDGGMIWCRDACGSCEMLREMAPNWSAEPLRLPVIR